MEDCEFWFHCWIKTHFVKRNEKKRKTHYIHTGMCTISSSCVCFFSKNEFYLWISLRKIRHTLLKIPKSIGRNEKERKKKSMVSNKEKKVDVTKVYFIKLFIYIYKKQRRKTNMLQTFAMRIILFLVCWDSPFRVRILSKTASVSWPNKFRKNNLLNPLSSACKWLIWLISSSTTSRIASTPSI